jgi:hypothetical protein
LDYDLEMELGEGSQFYSAYSKNRTEAESLSSLQHTIILYQPHQPNDNATEFVHSCHEFSIKKHQYAELSVLRRSTTYHCSQTVSDLSFFTFVLVDFSVSLR